MENALQKETTTLDMQIHILVFFTAFRSENMLYFKNCYCKAHTYCNKAFIIRS